MTKVIVNVLLATRKFIGMIFRQDTLCQEGIIQQGKQYEYSIYLGKSLSDDLLAKSRQLVKYSVVDLQNMIDFYTNELKALEY